MYKLELSLDVYQRLEKCLSEIHPEINLIFVSCDFTLASLGFAEQPPCVIHADLTRGELESLLDDLMQYEIDAYNPPETQGEPERTPEDQKFIRYGWMWDIFYSAEYIEA